MAKLTLTDIAGGYGLITTYNNNNALIEAALENTLSRDGTSPNTMSVNLDMNSNRIVNLTDPTGAQDAATKTYVDGQIQAVQSAGDFSPAISYDFTAAQTFSNTVTFDGSIVDFDNSGAGVSVRHFSADQTNSLVHFANNTDYVSTFAGFTDWDINGITGSMNLKDGVLLSLYDNADTDHFRLYSTTGNGYCAGGTAGMEFTFTSFDKVTCSAPFHINGYTMFIVEQTAADADIAGHGQIWVKDDTPNNLYFTDDAGNDIQITEGGALKGAASASGVLSTLSQKATDTTLADEADLSSITLLANTAYEVSCYLNISQNVGDFKCRFQFDNAPDTFDVLYFAVDDSGVSDEVHPTSGVSTVSITTMTDNDSYGLRIQGQLVTGGSPPTIDFQWAQNTSSANNTSILAGSFVSFRRL